MIRKLKALLCKVFWHRSPYWFVRFEYPRFEPWLWTRCHYCERALTKVPMRDVPLMELHTRWGVASDDVGLHAWARYRAMMTTNREKKRVMSD